MRASAFIELNVYLARISLALLFIDRPKVRAIVLKNFFCHNFRKHENINSFN